MYRVHAQSVGAVQNKWLDASFFYAGWIIWRWRASSSLPFAPRLCLRYLPSQIRRALEIKQPSPPHNDCTYSHSSFAWILPRNARDAKAKQIYSSTKGLYGQQSLPISWKRACTELYIRFELDNDTLFTETATCKKEEVRKRFFPPNLHKFSAPPEYCLKKTAVSLLSSVCAPCACTPLCSTVFGSREERIPPVRQKTKAAGERVRTLPFPSFLTSVSAKASKAG